MDNGEKTLSNLFDGRTIFNIPEYQRAYAWSGTQLNEFLDDLHNQKLGRSYFLGTVLFEEKGLEGNYKLIDIVDGQQRLTTIIIFMSCLISKLQSLASSDEEEEDLDLLYETYVKHRRQYKLRALDEDNDFFHSYILESKDGKSFIRTPAQRRLYEAKQFFKEKLDLLEKPKLEELKCKLDEYSRVLVYSVQDTAEATLIFETTNDRGKGLTNLEKIKSFMMYRSYVASEDVPEELLNKIRTRFSEIYKEYEQFSTKIDEDSILQYHFICHENWVAKEYQSHVQGVKNVVNQMISSESNVGALSYINTYTQKLKETFYTVHEILKSENLSIRELMILNRVGNFWPLLIKAYKLDETENKIQFFKLVRLLVCFSFRVYAINQNRGNTGQTKFFSLARDFSGDFSKLFIEILNSTKRYCDDKSFRTNLSYPDLYQWINSKDLNYFFWKYENYLRTTMQPKASPMSEHELTSSNSKLKLSIEHIASQNPRKGVVNDVSILPEVDEDFEESFLHNLGNLTIDPLSANSSKGNLDFDSKNTGYFLRAPFKSQNELESYLKDGLWTGSSVSSRQKVLIDFALQEWSLEV
ncbi:hypothetical protein VHA01S_029_00380 [Vibrio halioticoli NBRC 102217]|uniref:DUF262 domain-containing protein n=1 Tax=Vibrio halioticoli NBRC 102217 TaxID=1219072 RepID=V5HL55_9VIBR|nr:DUF262 domain-containing protein [Vibrio halioticoli]GAD89905.1 hypothetical protein VHA01S_029_00380 [Vibrio halioticoli NBRC 102217]